jgi:hypothetical protein
MPGGPDMTEAGQFDHSRASAGLAEAIFIFDYSA